MENCFLFKNFNKTYAYSDYVKIKVLFTSKNYHSVSVYDHVQHFYNAKDSMKTSFYVIRRKRYDDTSTTLLQC